jgi:hypothetical protein
VVQVCLPLSLGIAILRSRLWDIDVIINKTLVYGGLSVLLGALYAGLIIGLESLAGLFGGQAASNPLVLVISTLVIAALFLPVRGRIQNVIDRRFYRRKYDAEKTLASFSATLQSEVDLQDLHAHLLAVVQETMQPAHVSRLPSAAGSAHWGSATPVKKGPHMDTLLCLQGEIPRLVLALDRPLVGNLSSLDWTPPCPPGEVFGGCNRQAFSGREEIPGY